MKPESTGSEFLAAAPPTGTTAGGPAHEGAKERILRAASHLFAERGYEATPVRMIVEEAGVTKPVLYYYFKNKEALFRAIVTDTLEQFQQGLEEVCDADEGPIEQQLEAVMRHYVDTTHQIPELVKFIHAVVFSGHYDSIFEFPLVWRRSMESIARMFERARDRGQIRTEASSLNLAVQWSGLLMNIMQGLIVNPELTHEADPTHNAVDIFLRGVGPREAAPGPTRLNTKGITHP